MNDRPVDLRADGVSLAYDARPVVEDLTLAIPPGRITVIVGANACGKSTLLRALARLIAPSAGTVLLDGADIRSRPTAEVARRLGLLPQSPVAPEGVTVADLVGRGRYPHQSWLRRRADGDDEIVDAAMSRTEVLDLAARSVDSLSGGQRQRVWIAMALAQQTDVLLLDEPTTYLDVSHQIEVLDLLADLNREQGVTIVMVLHELSLACRYADHLIAMRNGRIVREGPPERIVDVDLVREVFGIESVIATDPASGMPLVSPISRHRRTPAPGDGTRVSERE